MLLADERREVLAEQMRALFLRTQALPGTQDLTEEDIANEIAAQRTGR